MGDSSNQHIFHFQEILYSSRINVAFNLYQYSSFFKSSTGLADANCPYNNNNCYECSIVSFVQVNWRNNSG